MKKMTIALAIMAFAGVALADTQGQAQGSNSNSTSAAVSTSQGGAGGTSTVSGVNASNGLTVGCLVNCASTDQGSRDLADSAVQAALINAQAARDVAAAMRDTQATIKNTPSVNGPALTSSNDTCMGSTSGSANVPGIGVGFGTSWVDNNCRMLKNSRELWNMGMKAAALALMCTDAANREALELTGFECPQAKAKKQAVKQVSEEKTEEVTDPYIRSRMGMPSLESTK